MWIAVIAAWLIGSTAMYILLVKTAREPQKGECMECRLTDCAECPHASIDKEYIKKAA